MDPIFDLIDGLQVSFERVIEWLADDRLQIGDVVTSAVDGRTATTHAGVVAQLALLQVRVRQGVLARDALVLRVVVSGGGGRQANKAERLTGSKTSICVSRWTASCVAWEDSW